MYKFSDEINKKLKEHKFILLGNEHFNPLGLVRSIGEYGLKVIAIIIKGEHRLTSYSRYIDVLHMVDSLEEGYNLLINEYGNESEMPFVFTCDDTTESLLDSSYDDLKDKFIFFNAGSQGRITKYMNKNFQNMLAEQIGVKTLWTREVDVGTIPKDIEFPIITKAIDSTRHGWKDEVHICHSVKELKEAYKDINSSKVLLQKYLKKKNELCLDGFSIDRGTQTFIAIGSTYKYLIDDTYSMYMDVENFHNISLQKKIDEVFKTVGYEGIFTIEFLEDNKGDYYFLEINFRNSGWSYASTCAGMNLPILWAAATLEGRIHESWESNIPVGFTAMVEIDDLRKRVKTKQIGLLEWYKEFKTANCKFIYNKCDMKPFRSELMSIVKRKLSI